MVENKKTSAKKSGAKKAITKKTMKKPALKKTTATTADAVQNPVQAKPAEDQTRIHSLRHFPATMFAGILGICSLGLAWRQAGVILEWPATPGELICWFGAGFAIAVYLLYALKAARYPCAVIEDFNHAVRGSFFTAGTMGLMLVASIILPYSRIAGEIIWITGIASTALVTLVIVKNWFMRQTIIKQMTPAWFIPPTGILAVPISGFSLGYQDLSWMLMGVGLVFWILLFTIFFNRQLFHPAISESLRPTLFILIAPPALCAIGFTVLDGGYMDNAAKMMYGIALFIALLMIVKIRRFSGLPFGMPWWSFTFPMAMLSIAATLYHDQDGGTISALIAHLILTATSILVFYILSRTLIAFARGKLFRAPEG